MPKGFKTLVKESTFNEDKEPYWDVEVYIIP